MTQRLTIELVPSTAWYSNVRSNVSPDEWDTIRRTVYKRAGYRCEVCGGKGPKHPVECHEIWTYDDSNHTQKLVGMIALCPACHAVKHIGRTSAMGYRDRAVSHLMEVNGWTREEATAYIAASFDTWRARSQHRWNLDISLLQKVTW